MRRMNWVRFYHNFDLIEKCRPVAHPFSTGAACRKENFDLNKISVWKLKNEPFKTQKAKYDDTFGNLDSFESEFRMIKEDPEDVKDYKRDKAAKGKKIPEYIKEVQEHLQKKDYKSALRVLEVDMYNDRKPPVAWIYTDLIMYNARTRNLEEAYRLYTNFKKFGGQPSGAMYTAMFAACQRSKNRELALKAATAVREYLMNDEIQKPNNTHYRAMIMAFGKQGDLVTCFKIFDELMYKRDKFTSSEFHAMLCAFMNDQNAGLRHALLFWRKMIQYRIPPTLEVFHDILHCVRYCSLGESKLLPNLIKEIDEQSKVFVRTKVQIRTKNDQKTRTVLKLPADGKKWFLNLKTPESEKNFKILEKKLENELRSKRQNSTHLEPEDTSVASLPLEAKDATDEGKSEVESEKDSVKIMNQSEEFSLPVSDHKSCDNLHGASFITANKLPNLIAFEPTLGSVVEFKAFTTPQDRFLLLGGLGGFLKVMLDFGVAPTSKTLTQLLFLVPEKKENYEQIIRLAEVLNIQLDTEFFNALLKLRIFLGEDFDAAQKYLQMMQEQKLEPDLLTFGTLALACVNLKYASQLVKAVDSFGFRLNSQIVGAFLNKATFAGDLEYVKGILDMVKNYEVRVDGKFMSKLVHFVSKHKHLKDAKNIQNKVYTYSTS